MHDGIMLNVSIHEKSSLIHVCAFTRRCSRKCSNVAYFSSYRVHVHVLTIPSKGYTPGTPLDTVCCPTVLMTPLDWPSSEVTCPNIHSALSYRNQLSNGMKDQCPPYICERERRGKRRERGGREGEGRMGRERGGSGWTISVRLHVHEHV